MSDATFSLIFDSLREDMQGWRHDVHRHSEFGFEEQRTAKLVAHELRSFRLEVHTGIGTTGVARVLQRGRSNRAIGLRADMDCLPRRFFHETRARVG